MRISDWSSDVCSSDIVMRLQLAPLAIMQELAAARDADHARHIGHRQCFRPHADQLALCGHAIADDLVAALTGQVDVDTMHSRRGVGHAQAEQPSARRSEEHTSELQSLMRNSY